MKPIVKVKAPSRPMLTVVDFKRPASGEILEMMTTFKEMVEDGQISGMAIAALKRNGGVVTGYHHNGSLFPMVGAVRTVAVRLESEIDRG